MPPLQSLPKGSRPNSVGRKLTLGDPAAGSVVTPPDLGERTLYPWTF